MSSLWLGSPTLTNAAGLIMRTGGGGLCLQEECPCPCPTGTGTTGTGTTGTGTDGTGTGTTGTGTGDTGTGTGSDTCEPCLIPQTGTQVGGGAVALWNLPSNITADDGAIASVPWPFFGISTRLVGKKFDFQSIIPATAEILGIITKVKRRNGAGDPITDLEMSLTLDGIVPLGANRASSTIWTPGLTFETIEYGGPTDLWGHPWTAAEVRDPDFGMMLIAQNANAPSVGGYPHVDVFWICICWQETGTGSSRTFTGTGTGTPGTGSGFTGTSTASGTDCGCPDDSFVVVDCDGLTSMPTHIELRVPPGSITDLSCNDCSHYEGCHILSYVSGCRWEVANPFNFGCDPNNSNFLWALEFEKFGHTGAWILYTADSDDRVLYWSNSSSAFNGCGVSSFRLLPSPGPNNDCADWPILVRTASCSDCTTGTGSGTTGTGTTGTGITGTGTVCGGTSVWEWNGVTPAAGFWQLISDGCTGSGVAVQPSDIGTGFFLGEQRTVDCFCDTGTSTALDTGTSSGLPSDPCDVVGLFNTGEETTSTSTCPTDDHWTIDGSPARVLLSTPTWIDATGGSEWVAPACDDHVFPGAEGVRSYNYRTTFTVPAGVDPRDITINGQFAVDSTMYQILVNGSDATNGQNCGLTGQHVPACSQAFTTFSISNFLTVGVNNIIFKVWNHENPSPSGLVVEWTGVECPGTGSGTTACVFPGLESTGASTSTGTGTASGCDQDLNWEASLDNSNFYQAPQVVSHAAWATPIGDESWISGNCDWNVNAPIGQVVWYRLKFDIPVGTDLSSVVIKGRWSADDGVGPVTLNGNDLGISCGPDSLLCFADVFYADREFTINPLFLAVGENTFLWKTTNATPVPADNPTGFMVLFSQVTCEQVGTGTTTPCNDCPASMYVTSGSLPPTNDICVGCAGYVPAVVTKAVIGDDCIWDKGSVLCGIGSIWQLHQNISGTLWNLYAGDPTFHSAHYQGAVAHVCGDSVLTLQTSNANCTGWPATVTISQTP